MKKLKGYFTVFELILLSVSILSIVLSFVIFGGQDILTFIASLIGVTALLLNAKGNPTGQVLIIIFSILYGIISFGFSYYGEMITYLGMSLPMAVLALISWIRNPYGDGHSQVKVSRLSRREAVFMLLIGIPVAVIFWFILGALNTANLIPSTVSVFISFLAAYLTFRRSEYFALLYAINDVVRIVLWVLAAIHDTSYTSVIICFAVFLINDLYGFISWRIMRKRQAADKAGAESEK